MRAAPSAMRCEEEHLLRVRARSRLVCALIAVFFPISTIFDAWTEPEHYALFLALRVPASLAAMIGLAAVSRARTEQAARFWGTVTLVLGIAALAWMVVFVESTVEGYSMGLVVSLLGAGVVAAWPPRIAVTAMALIVVPFAIGVALVPSPSSTAELVTRVVVVFAAAAIGGGGTVLRERMERRLIESAARLERTQAALVEAEKLSALGRMLAGLSHEINNPVNVVQNNLEPMREHLGAIGEVLDEVERALPGLPEPIRRAWQRRDISFAREDLGDALDTVEAAARRIRAIHQDLRAYTRREGPSLVYGDPSMGLRTTVAMLRRGLRPGVVLESEIADLPATWYRAGQLDQVFLNLLQNALDAIGPTGRIAARASSSGGVIVFEVEDDGPGVPAEMRPHLFEPFFTTKGVGRGTGLGLATSYEIVQQHGGQIHLADKSTRGARFVFTLPILTQGTAGSAAELCLGQGLPPA